jgi:hypothetical protein
MCASPQPPTQSDITPQTYRAYKINYLRPGVVNIFNNKEFTDTEAYPIRHGSEKDVWDLCTLFRGLNYVVRPPFIDKTKADKREAINASVDYASYGCLIIFIMSHIDKNRIISSDSEIIDLNEFIMPLKRNASLQ